MRLLGELAKLLNCEAYQEQIDLGILYFFALVFLLLYFVVRGGEKNDNRKVV